MTGNKSTIIIFILLIGIIVSAKDKYSYEYSGELSLQGGGYSLLDNADFYGGLHILPYLQGRVNLNNTSFLDLQISLNGFSSYLDKWDNQLKLYRLALSYQSLQTEIKAGLQKITFGPAKYLRPLMWFDRINPTDPMQITEGVYGSLFRYYTMDNKNIWIWGLYGNDDLKGLERFKSEPDIPELGGRIQIPVPKGEMAFSYHGRRIIDNSPSNNDEEQRFALDGYFDLGIGLWFESVFSLVSDHKDRFMSTIGADYTFSIGNGLNVIFEFMPIRYVSNTELQAPKENLYALSVSYPLNIMDQLMYLTYYSETMDKLFHYFQFQRTYDKISFNFALFHYPDIGYDVFTGRESNIAGLGAQVMAIYNF
jgi:hypothetical protein